MRELVTALAITFVFPFFVTQTFAQAPDGQALDAFVRAHSFNSSASLNGVASPQPGSIAYRTDVGLMFYRNNSAWVQFGGGGSAPSGWNLTGNAIGGSTSNFIGTSDNSVFRIRANNIEKLLIMPDPAVRRRVLFPSAAYDPLSGLDNSAVLGINGNQGRLRITSGNDDTFNNSQGASIDLHGNNAESPFSGRLDLVAGSSTSFHAITFHTSSGFAATMTANGTFGIGTAIPSTSMRLHVDGDAGKAGGGAWTVVSDRRIKKNITPYDKGLEHIMKIRPVSYQYTEQSGVSDLDRIHVGIIAQEIEKVLPSTVQTFHDSLTSGIEDFRTFNGSEILFTLINAVKELDQKNKALRKENAENRVVIQQLMKTK